MPAVPSPNARESPLPEYPSPSVGEGGQGRVLVRTSQQDLVLPNTRVWTVGSRRRRPSARRTVQLCREERRRGHVRIWFARRSSRFSRSRAARRSASLLVVPGRCPASVSAFFTQRTQRLRMNPELIRDSPDRSYRGYRVPAGLDRQPGRTLTQLIGVLFGASIC